MDVMDLTTLCRSLQSDADTIADEIVDSWKDISDSEQWLELPEQLDHDHLPDMIRSLAEAGLCTDFQRKACHKVGQIAAEHGAHRATEGFGENLIYREYHLLRRALASTMKERHGESATVYYASMRVDVLVSLASAAALHGLHKDELEREGRWPNVLQELLDGWPLPDS